MKQTGFLRSRPKPPMTATEVMQRTQVMDQAMEKAMARMLEPTVVRVQEILLGATPFSKITAPSPNDTTPPETSFNSYGVPTPESE